jgi:type IV pilus biogenesis protein CpaD/CtpE
MKHLKFLVLLGAAALVVSGCAVPVKTGMTLPLGAPTPQPLAAMTAATAAKNATRLRRERLQAGEAPPLVRATAPAEASQAAAYWRALY